VRERIEYRFRVPSAAIFTLYSYSKVLEYRFRVSTAGSLSTQHIQNAFKCTEEVWAEANDPHRKKGWHCTWYIVCSKQHWKSPVTPPSNQRRKRYPCADYTVRTQPQRKSWVHCHLLWCLEIVDFHGVFSQPNPNFNRKQICIN
jgi:hypothetical protein